MFVLAEFEDLVKIKPSSFKDSLHDAIIEVLNKKLANKVVLQVGLCIALHDIIDIGDSFVFPGDGSHHTKVKYRFVVFRPFMNELLTGKIKSCSQDGVQVTLGFFDDILIPASYLQHPSKFSEEEQLWIWEYTDKHDNKHQLYMDVGEKIRFRIISESFSETSPEECDKKAAITNNVPYSLVASCAETGLGIVKWWDGL